VKTSNYEGKEWAKKLKRI
jgi:hypothetical protein